MDRHRPSQLDLLSLIDPRALGIPAKLSESSLQPSTEKKIPISVEDGRLHRRQATNRTAYSELSRELSREVNETTHSATFGALFDIIRQDVYLSRDKLLMLNPSRRDLVSRRLAFNAARIARSRGERMNRQQSLPDLLRESYRPATKDKTLGLQSLDRFTAEVALYHLLQIFCLKSMAQNGWRNFQKSDIQRANYELNIFLKNNSLSFTTDRHSWNFIRPNIYSWYQPSVAAFEACAKTIEEATEKWSEKSPKVLPNIWTEHDLLTWLSELPSEAGLSHLGFGQDRNAAIRLWDFIEDELGFSILSFFHGSPHAKKVFIPTIESGGVAIEGLFRLTKSLENHSSSLELQRSDSLRRLESIFHESFWACDYEGLETYFTEIISLIRLVSSPIIQRTKKTTDEIIGKTQRLPHGIRCFQGVALELHNHEQLALGETSGCVQQGTALFIQEYESFDLSIVLDHPDRSKSSRWMKHISEQIPYWRQWLGNNTNLNWGETHLQLGLSKLKEGGRLVYLSHKVLPDHEDGERFRKYVLGGASVDYFIELPHEPFAPYRYLYVFSKCTNKTARDKVQVRYGKWPEESPIHWDNKGFAVIENASLKPHLETSSCAQWEISDRGWDQIFVKGTGPLIRHLNHKCTKLFQLATIQLWTPSREDLTNSGDHGLFSDKSPSGLELKKEAGHYRFVPLQNNAIERIAIFPHNNADLNWLRHILNSPAVRFWIESHIASDTGTLRIQDMRNIPIVDLSRSNPQVVHDTLEWLGRVKPQADTIRRWLSENDPVHHGARYCALAKRHSGLEKSVTRYSHLFDELSADIAVLNPEAIPRFYPNSLLTTLLQSSEVKVQYAKKETSTSNPNYWILKDCAVTPSLPGRDSDRTLVHLFMKQGPQVILSVPISVAPYLKSQLFKLVDFTWGEIQGLLKVPQNIALFVAQCSEITKVVQQSVRDLKSLEGILADLSLELYEVSAEDREYLPKQHSLY
jgi:hypothetical protein